MDISAPDAKVIDFTAIANGDAYPKDNVTVILNDKLGYDAYLLQKKMSAAAISGDSDERIKLEKEYEAVVAAAAGSTYTFHLTGVDSNHVKAILDKTISRFDIKRNLMGGYDFTPEAEDYYKANIWSLYIEKIEGPDGAVAVAPTAENLAAFISKFPKAVKKIDGALEEIAEGTVAGFESIIKSADFLSSPSAKG